MQFARAWRFPLWKAKTKWKRDSFRLSRCYLRSCSFALKNLNGTEPEVTGISWFYKRTVQTKSCLSEKVLAKALLHSMLIFQRVYSANTHMAKILEEDRITKHKVKSAEMTGKVGESHVYLNFKGRRLFAFLTSQIFSQRGQEDDGAPAHRHRQHSLCRCKTVDL